jgi:hypothetical protein
MITPPEAITRSKFALKGRKMPTTEAVIRPQIPAKRKGANEEKSY